MTNEAFRKKKKNTGAENKELKIKLNKYFVLNEQPWTL